MATTATMDESLSPTQHASEMDIDEALSLLNTSTSHISAVSSSEICSSGSSTRSSSSSSSSNETWDYTSHNEEDDYNDGTRGSYRNNTNGPMDDFDFYDQTADGFGFDLTSCAIGAATTSTKAATTRTLAAASKSKSSQQKQSAAAMAAAAVAANAARGMTSNNNRLAVSDPLICTMCGGAMVFNVGGDSIKCSSAACSHYSMPITEATVSSLPFDAEVFFTATFAHMTAAKANQPIRKQADIFGRLKTPVLHERVITYITKCVVAATGKTKASDITIDEIFACLRAHGWKELYGDKLVHVFCSVTRRPLPVLSQITFEKINAKFRDARVVYGQLDCRQKSAKSDFVDYFFAWRKIIELVKAVHVLPYIRSLDPAKVESQEVHWVRICEKLNWPFVPTPRVARPVIPPLHHLLKVSATGESFLPATTPPAVNTGETAAGDNKEVVPNAAIGAVRLEKRGRKRRHADTLQPATTTSTTASRLSHIHSATIDAALALMNGAEEMLEGEDAHVTASMLAEFKEAEDEELRLAEEQAAIPAETSQMQEALEVAEMERLLYQKPPTKKRKLGNKAAPTTRKAFTMMSVAAQPMDAPAMVASPAATIAC